MADINYTIIIPHHDIPDLLVRCVSSIPKRDDIQIVVVDDCSPGGESYLVKYPMLQRSDLEYYHLHENGGGGKARNEGLKHAKGKWLIFADADDFFNYCFDDVLTEYVDSESDIIFCNANSVDSKTYQNSSRINYVNHYFQEDYYNKEQQEYTLRFVAGEPWCKIIRKKLVVEHNVKFDETPIHNDTKFSYLVGYYAKTISTENRAIYCVTDRSDSVSKDLDNEKYLVRIRVFFEKYIFLKEHGIDYPLIDSLVYFAILHFNITKQELYLQKAMKIAVSLGIDKKYLLQQYEREYKKHRIANRKNLLKTKLIQLVNTLF